MLYSLVKIVLYFQICNSQNISLGFILKIFLIFANFSLDILIKYIVIKKSVVIQTPQYYGNITFYLFYLNVFAPAHSKNQRISVAR